MTGLDLAFLRREIAGSGRQAVVFVLCVALSVMAFVGVATFRQGIRDSLFRDARTLQAGDLVARSNYPLTPGFLAGVRELETTGRAQSATVVQFYSVARSGEGTASVLAEIKGVGPGYPFYGRVVLASGREFSRVLTPGRAVVERTLLDRLGLAVGGRIILGEATLAIADVVISEPDRPVSFLAFGPRIFVAEADLPALDLLHKGSRVSHGLRLKLSPGEDPDAVAATLRALAAPDQEQVDTWRTAYSRVQRFFENFLFYLSLTAMFILLVAGIGIHGALSALLREKEGTIAAIKAVGAGTRFVMGHYLALALVLGLAGVALGLGAGVGLGLLTPLLFGDLLPSGMTFRPPMSILFQGLALGSGVVLVFGFAPLAGVSEVKPARVMRLVTGSRRRAWPMLTSVLAGLAGAASLVWLQIEDRETGLWFLLGLGGVVVVAALLSWAVLWILSRLRPRGLVMETALRGLFRPGGAIRPLVASLASAVAVLGATWLVERNLDAGFVQAFPPDAPNLFFVDIQPDQREVFTEILGRPAEFHPVIRARLTAINGQAIDPETERRRQGDNLARSFNLTYRDQLLSDEFFREGDRLFRDDLEGLQVSVLDTVAEIRSMKVGDRLSFKIQGVPLEAVVSSIRGRDGARVRPFFYFVFPENSPLKDAPQTIFCAVRVSDDEIGAIQNRVVARLPNISVIDAAATIRSLAGVLERMSAVIRFYAAFSLTAGLLMLAGSLMATRLDRLREAAYYQVLGTPRRTVTRIFLLEHLLIGSLAAVTGLGLAVAIAWWVCVHVFDIPFSPFPELTAFMAGVVILMVTVVGGLSAREVSRVPPVVFLREQTGE